MKSGQMTFTCPQDLFNIFYCIKWAANATSQQPTNQVFNIRNSSSTSMPKMDGLGGNLQELYLLPGFKVLPQFSVIQLYYKSKFL